MTSPTDLLLPSEQAKLLRDEGMDRAVDHAERCNPYWQVFAMDYLKGYLDEIGSKPFMGEDFRKWSEEQGLQKPPTGRAYGAVIMRAHRKGLIRSIGYSQTTNPTAHCAIASIWQSTLNFTDI